jgi:hypothetical protein
LDLLKKGVALVMFVLLFFLGWWAIKMAVNFYRRIHYTLTFRIGSDLCEEIEFDFKGGVLRRTRRFFELTTLVTLV